MSKPTLAICEYLHERFPEHQLWPADPGSGPLGVRGDARRVYRFAPGQEHEYPRPFPRPGAYA